MAERCGAEAGTVLIDGEERIIACTLDAGHEKPYHPECSCERHDVEWWAAGKPHEMRLAWGRADPKPYDAEKEDIG